jgi:DNA repair protein RadC
MAKVKSENPPAYKSGRSDPALDDQIIARALEILEKRCARGAPFTGPDEIGKYLTVRYSAEPAEVFGVIFLDNRHAVIETEELFRGTIDACTVYPRIVAQRALQVNAAAVVFYHNHPSGNPEPSQADRTLTDNLRNALALFQIRTVDHIVAAGGRWTSFVARGWI